MATEVHQRTRSVDPPDQPRGYTSSTASSKSSESWILPLNFPKWMDLRLGAKLSLHLRMASMKSSASFLKSEGSELIFTSRSAAAKMRS